MRIRTTSTTRRTHLTVGLVLIAGACTADGDVTDAPDGTTSAVIVTTTTTVADEESATTSAVSPTTDAPASVDPAPEPAGSTVAPTTAPPTAPPTTPPTTTVPPVVGDPVVASEVVGSFSRPVDLAVRAGDEALFVVEQAGRIIRASGGDRVTALDVDDRLSRANEQGLLGLAFSPDGTLAYVNYTDGGGTTTIAEYAVASDGVFDPATERIVLTVDQPYSNHNAGDLAFGPDDMLYIPLGDGGSGGDPERRADDPSSLLGSLLRIDPTPDGDAPYTIPADNPFADGGDGAPEVWAWGLRNPWKIAFDPVTNELWIADVGQNRVEEVNVVAPADGVPAGRALDFGWSAFEGTDRFNTDVDDSGITMPVLTYLHGDDGCSISGGVPYRGTAVAELAPAYVYSDFCSGRVWALDLAGGRNIVLGTFQGVTAVRTGPDGEIYVLEGGGDVHRLVQG